MMDNKLELDPLMFAGQDILVSVKFNMEVGKNNKNDLLCWGLFSFMFPTRWLKLVNGPLSFYSG